MIQLSSKANIICQVGSQLLSCRLARDTEQDASVTPDCKQLLSSGAETCYLGHIEASV